MEGQTRCEVLKNLEKKLREWAQDDELLVRAKVENPWFTEAFSKEALLGWAVALRSEAVDQWCRDGSERISPKVVGLICAGNLPLVGLHDVLTAYAAGHQVHVKLSADDRILMRTVIQAINDFDGQSPIQEVERLNEIDAVIATGSSNSLPYFETYFGAKPHVFRESRTSVAIVEPDMSEEELKGLARDIFLYFGRGCRSVTHLFLPEGWDEQQLFESWFDWGHLAQHARYGANYDYHRALFMLNKEPFLENNFAILREHPELKPPVGVIHCSRYDDREALHEQLSAQSDAIQVVVGRDQAVPFGQSQQPELWDYADGVDTLKFCTSLS